MSARYLTVILTDKINNSHVDSKLLMPNIGLVTSYHAAPSLGDETTYTITTIVGARDRFHGEHSVERAMLAESIASIRSIWTYVHIIQASCLELDDAAWYDAVDEDGELLV